MDVATSTDHNRLRRICRRSTYTIGSFVTSSLPMWSTFYRQLPKFKLIEFHGIPTAGRVDQSEIEEYPVNAPMRISACFTVQTRRMQTPIVFGAECVLRASEWSECILKLAAEFFVRLMQNIHLEWHQFASIFALCACTENHMYGIDVVPGSEAGKQDPKMCNIESNIHQMDERAGSTFWIAPHRIYYNICRCALPCCHIALLLYVYSHSQSHCMHITAREYKQAIMCSYFPFI